MWDCYSEQQLHDLYVAEGIDLFSSCTLSLLTDILLRPRAKLGNNLSFTEENKEEREEGNEERTEVEEKKEEVKEEEKEKGH